jgi:hypothetical protein
MESLSLSICFERIAEKSAQMAGELNRCLDRYEELCGTLSVDGEIRELEALLCAVRLGGAKALKLLREVPGPNRVPGELAPSVVEVTNALFNFASSCDNREKAILRDVRSLN